MGWNDVAPGAGTPLFAGLETDAALLFPAFVLLRLRRDARTRRGDADYGVDFGCAVQRGNVYGVQFHPEKSHHYGAQLLKNFAEL